MEALEKLASNPKLEGGQYGELLGSLKKVSLYQGLVYSPIPKSLCLARTKTRFKGLKKHYGNFISVSLASFKYTLNCLLYALTAIGDHVVNLI